MTSASLLPYFQDLISYIEMRQLDKFYPMTIFRFVTRQTGLVLTLTLSSYDVQADSSSCREVKTKLAVLSRSLRLLIRVCSVYLTNLARALDIEPPAEVVQVIQTSHKYFFTKFQIFFTKYQLFLQHPSLSLATADSQYSLDCSETGLPPLTNTVSSSLSLVTVSDNLIVENDSCTYIK